MEQMQTYQPEGKSRKGLFIGIAVAVIVIAVALIVIFSGSSDTTPTDSSTDTGSVEGAQLAADAEVILTDGTIPEDNEVDLGDLI